MIKKIFTVLIIGLSLNILAQTTVISAGGKYSVAVCADGSVNSWGNNVTGQLATGDLINRKLAQKITSLSGITKVSASFNHSLFLKNDGTVWACGYNFSGQLGDGTNTLRITPVLINGLSGIIEVSAGGGHSLFLKNDGTVWACGNNALGQLGDSTIINKNIPVQVAGLSGIVAISAGAFHSLFLKNDGTVLACGSNLYGESGDGTNYQQNSPVTLNGLSGITAISAGGSHSLFLKNNGKVMACGTNVFGQLGDGTTLNKNSPVQVVGLTSITAISAGGNNFNETNHSYNFGNFIFFGHSLFLKNDGTVWACGDNEQGQLGDATGLPKNVPVQIQGLANITGLSVGSEGHSLFLKNDGTVWACGNNESGQLGDGTDQNKFSPVQINSCVVIPQPPTVNFSNLPTSLCLGGNVNVEPNIEGSNPSLAYTADSSIVLNSPKAMTKNNMYVFILEGNSAIKRFGFDGTLQATYNSGGAIANIKVIAAGTNDTVFANNGNGNIYKIWQGGSSLVPSPSFAGFNPPKAMVNIPSTIFPENLLVNDSTLSSPYMINTNSTNGFTNTQPFSEDVFNTSIITSISYDNKEYPNKRLLLTNPANNKIWTRKFDGPNLSNDAKLLVDSTITQGKAYDFIYADTINDIITLSSSTSKALGFITTQKNPDGSSSSNIDEFIGYLLQPQKPVGMLPVKPNGNLFQVWVADQAKNKLFRATIYLYQITPALPSGLKFNQITGKIDGTPINASSPQTYQVIVSNQFGADTSLFTFGVSPAGPINNNIGTNSTTGVQDDGLTIKYYEPNNCSPLIEIADSIGGTFPGRTKITQTVYPLVSVISTDSLVRRVNLINADNKDSIKANVKLYYSYDDIKLFNQSRGSTLLSNDTIGGTMNMAVLQMHDKPNGGKMPIIHSPIAAKWSTTNHIWIATVPVTKFSEFYGSDMGTLTTFDCSNTGSQTLNLPTSYYVWNYDTLFISGTYVDTLINKTGCDSITTLNITLSPVGLNEASIGSGCFIYPNPSAGVFTVKASSINAIESKVRVLNVLGNVVYTGNINGSGQIDLSKQEVGVYFIIIETVDKSIIQRVIKQ